MQPPLLHTREEVQEAVRSSSRFQICGAGTKTALSKAATHSLSGLSDLVEYNPSEYTLTAQAGISLTEVNGLLKKHGQYLPYDPPFATKGATLGGTIAAGLSGPGRYRYGGVRDFLLGIQFVNGEGRLVRGGAKVVKNAAGFDLPKLMVGSLGRFGILLECSCKVFPLPERTCTVRAVYESMESTISAMSRLAIAPFDLMCLDIVPPSTLLARIGGMEASLATRARRLNTAMETPTEVLENKNDEVFWENALNFNWVPSHHSLLKIPISPGSIPALECAAKALDPAPTRRYSVGGNVCWMGWPDELGEKSADRFLTALQLPGVAITGSFRNVWPGKHNGHPFSSRLLQVLDPKKRFQPHET